MLKKSAKVWSFIVILLIIGSAFVGVVTAEEIIIDTEITESRFMEYPSRPVIGWYYIFDHDTFHTKAYNDNFWYTLCGEKGHGDPFFGVWQASLPQSGDYEVFVWIPDPDPFVEGWSPDRTYTPTQSAVYQIYHKAGMTTKTVNQELRTGGFYSLGTFNFDTRASVILNDRTGESYLSTMIAFDAVKFVPVAAPNNPPYTPSNPSPANHAIGQSIYTDLSWTGGDPDAGDTVTYDIYFGTSTSPLKVSTAQSGTTYDPGTLNYNTKYYWKIEATDNHGAPTTGPLLDFTTGSVAVHDMTVTDVYTAPDSPNVDQLTTIYVTVKNEGSQQENDVPVKAYVDGSQVGSTQHVTLSAGKSTTKSFTWTPSSAKTYSVKGEIWVVSGETDTRDNTKTISVSVQQQNLYWLAKAIMSEASVGTQEERIAVGWTVLNRLDSNDFPSTIKQVVESGYAHTQEPTQKIIDQSKNILERKYSDPTGGATHFFSPRSMGSGYGPYKIPGTDKSAYIPDWTIPKGYSKESPPPDDWEMTEFYQTIDNTEWVSDVENVRNWYFMFYRFINQPPVAIFTYSPENPLSGQTIIFKASDSYEPDPNGEIFSYKWNFGDGTIIEGLAESGLEEHRFRGAMGEPKEYTVKLTVKDNKGATASYTDSITVYPLKRYIIFYSSLSQFLPPPAPKIMEVTVYYNWVEETNGQDEYIVSEVHLDSELSLSFALYMFYINDDSQKIWSKLHKGVGKEDVSFTYPFNVPRDHAKTIGNEYFEGLAVGSNSNLNFVVDGLELGLNLRPTFFRVSRTIELGPGKQTEVPSIYPEGEMAGILAALSSPAELHIYDSQGNVTGLVNGKIKEAILNSIYDEESKTGVIFSPEDINSYSYEIVGTDEGLYGLGVTSVEDGEVNTFTATNIPTSTNAIHQYTIDWAALSQGEKGGTVKMDSNGNGTFERTIITNNSFHPLIAEFTVSPENPIIGEKVTLDASTSFDLGGGVIKKYCWEFYNAANQDPFYVIEGHDKKIIRYSFTSEGIYLVRLTVTDDEGEYSYTESSITIKESIKEPAFYVPDDYSTIQAAVDAANAGDTIIVRDGTYTENVDVDKSLTLKSSSGNPEYTIVKPVDPFDDVFSVTADHVKISGFTVTEAEAPAYVIYIYAYGIYLYNADYCDISDNICSHRAFGIYLEGSNSNSISDNTCINNEWVGISLNSSTKNSISNNTCSNNGCGGIGLACSTKNSIANNTCSNNGYGGICLECCNQNSISNNLCCNNELGIGIYPCWVSDNNCIYLNNFINNDCNAYSHSSTDTWYSPVKLSYTYNGKSHTNYLGNYWSDYTGTDANKNGIGDSPYSIDDRGGDIDQDDYPLMTMSGRYFNPSPTIPTPPTSTLTPTPRPRLAPTPTLTPTPRPTLRPTATLFEKIEGLIAAIRVGVGI